MQEYNNEKIVALSFKSTKVTTNVLVKVLKKLLELQKKRNSVIIHGKQPLKALIRGNDNASVTNIEINDQNIKAFEKTARKYGITLVFQENSSNMTRANLMTGQNEIQYAIDTEDNNLQQDMVSLQSLISKRDNAFSTASKIVEKADHGASSTIQNIV